MVEVLWLWEEKIEGKRVSDVSHLRFLILVSFYLSSIFFIKNSRKKKKEKIFKGLFCLIIQ